MVPTSEQPASIGVLSVQREGKKKNTAKQNLRNTQNVVWESVLKDKTILHRLIQTGKVFDGEDLYNMGYLKDIESVQIYWGVLIHIHLYIRT